MFVIALLLVTTCHAAQAYQTATQDKVEEARRNVRSFRANLAAFLEKQEKQNQEEFQAELKPLLDQTNESVHASHRADILRGHEREANMWELKDLDQNIEKLLTEQDRLINVAHQADFGVVEVGTDPVAALQRVGQTLTKLHAKRDELINADQQACISYDRVETQQVENLNAIDAEIVRRMDEESQRKAKAALDLETVNGSNVTY